MTVSPVFPGGPLYLDRQYFYTYLVSGTVDFRTVCSYIGVYRYFYRYPTGSCCTQQFARGLNKKIHRDGRFY